MDRELEEKLKKLLERLLEEKLLEKQKNLRDLQSEERRPLNQKLLI